MTTVFLCEGTAVQTDRMAVSYRTLDTQSPLAEAIADIQKIHDIDARRLGAFFLQKEQELVQLGDADVIWEAFMDFFDRHRFNHLLWEELKDLLPEDAPANNVGGGAIAGAAPGDVVVKTSAAVLRRKKLEDGEEKNEEE